MTNTHIVGKTVVALSFVAMVAVNAAATLLPINGQTTAEVSDSYPNIFAPAGFTFAIWGVIYLLLALYTLYQLGLFREKKSKLPNDIVMTIAPYFAASSLVNIAWIFSWHYNLIGLSVLLMVTLLGILIALHTKLYALDYTPRERLLVRAPFSVYFGWISVATIANVTTYLVYSGWDRLGQTEVFWMILMLVIGAAVGITTTLKRYDCAYGAVFVWAYWGILQKHLSSEGWDNMYPEVSAAMLILLPALVGATGYVLLKTLKQLRQR